MKKISSILFVFVFLLSLVGTPVLAAPLAITTTPTTSTQELGQLKVCKSAGAGVTVGQLFTINVNNTSYNVPAGPTDGGYCVLAGQFPLNLDVTVQEVIPAGYHVSNIEVKPDRAQSTNVELGKVIVEIGSGVTEVIFTNRASGLPTPTARPTNTPTATPSCAPNCTPTPTPTPKGRLQICKEADGAGVSGYFSFNFVNRSKTVPVGACSALITVEAGTLTINEVARAGFRVTDVYTIPPNRLISKNLNAGSATVTIVQGNASTQTIVVFRNRAESQASTPTRTPTGTITPATPTRTGTVTPPTSTPTGTITPATFTPTGTITPATSTPTGTITPPTPTGSLTPPVCIPTLVRADFSQVAVGGSIEGMGAVVPNLNIDAVGTAVRIIANAEPTIYIAPSLGIINNGISATSGFSDKVTQTAQQAPLYNFTFAAGMTIDNFSLHMLDFGDFNPSNNPNHSVSMIAYDASGVIVDRQDMIYTTNGFISPNYDNLMITGDAISSAPGQPGNWTWHVSGSGIVRVELRFGTGFDPNVGFDNLSFGTECRVCPAVRGDFSQVAVGASIEGMGAVVPNLNIDAVGTVGTPGTARTAVRIIAGAEPTIYIAPSLGIINNGISATGGFADKVTQTAQQAPLYNFTFAAGMTIRNFSLHMLDFGDFNPSNNPNHSVSMIAYDASGVVVDRQDLNYTTNGFISPVYLNLLINGDAISSAPGQPGNWTWRVSGSGIVRVTLEFGTGFDPNVGFDNLSFNPECAVIATR